MAAAHFQECDDTLVSSVLERDSMTNRKRIVPVVASSLASALCIGALAVPMSTYTPQAYADTYSDLVNAQNSHAQSKQREAALREQLAGVNSDLADKIVELDDLNNNKIPAAQAKVQQANSDAAAAKSEADAAAERLKAAEKDKADLEAKIKQTGEDYDDAHAAVAQSARESMHGSDTSDVMSVMTGSKDTKDFIKSMQSRDALARNEANAASDAAVDLNTSMNRADRLKAIEKRVEQCKNDADQKSAAAHSAATQAQQEKSSLDKLRAAGESTRADLENQKSSLTTQAAQQAAQTVMLQSEIDAKNQQWAAEQAAAAAQVQEPEPQGTVEAPAAAAPQPSVPQQTQTPSQPAQTQRPSTPSQPSIPSQPSTPSTPVVTRPSTGGQAHRTAITGMHTQQASALGGPMSVASRWASARHRISGTAASGGARPHHMGCASTIALRSGPLCRSCRGRRAPRAHGVMSRWSSRSTATAFSSRSRTWLVCTPSHTVRCIIRDGSGTSTDSCQ